MDVATTGILEPPFTESSLLSSHVAGFFIVDRSLPNMSCDVEINDSDSPLSDIEINIDPEIVAPYIRGPDRVVHKGKEYLWHKHRDNTRAFSKPSII
jgi:hypothetical protein